MEIADVNGNIGKQVIDIDSLDLLYDESTIQTLISINITEIR